MTEYKIAYDFPHDYHLVVFDYLICHFSSPFLLFKNFFLSRITIYMRKFFM